MFIGNYVEKVKRKRKDEASTHRERKYELHKCWIFQRITGLS